MIIIFPCQIAGQEPTTLILCALGAPVSPYLASQLAAAASINDIVYIPDCHIETAADPPAHRLLHFNEGDFFDGFGMFACLIFFFPTFKSNWA